MFQFVCPPMPHCIVAGEDTYPAGGTHPDRSNIGVFDLLVVTGGALELEENGMPLQVEAGHYAILRPDRAHRTAVPCRSETHFYWVHFQTLGRWEEVYERQTPAVRPPVHPYDQVEYFTWYIPQAGRIPVPEAVYSELRGILLQRHPDAASRWKRQQHFLAALLQLQEAGGAVPASPRLAVAEEAAVFLRRHYREPLHYKRMSEALHFHANYIALCMKEAFGCTPLEYLTRYRIEQAKLLLVNTNEPVGKVAEETGFGSFPYFVRCFRRHAGLTPSAFRKQFRSVPPE
ncbi:putative HTH-type transcriptional regulator YisR [Paenibacillus cisolokensis]|uniref:HTH-type transcriptional regulator YisR n=1 Tax=Paenibacillus cisolokensis TaxID=1658519 RepID=A0ABQ4N538_9BACL|nr:helix-turn-helix transcriptional regulator [Paenibacillus cisolokensis]GIQ63262.1 putative HTH-type transcriptional regulator YisR [Paenibacillus cisolokensis]